MEKFNIKEWQEKHLNESQKLDAPAEALLDAIQTAKRSIKNLDDITVQATSKGNWKVMYKGKKLFILNRKNLSDDTIRKYGLEG